MNTFEKAIHGLPIVSLVVLIEPKLIDVDEEAEKGEGSPSAWNFICKAKSIILKKVNNEFLKKCDLGAIRTGNGVQIAKAACI